LHVDLQLKHGFYTEEEDSQVHRTEFFSDRHRVW
jgi:hypothetical protein